MKYIILLATVVSIFAPIAHGENKRVELIISDNITWKDFFDGGFHPKHVMNGHDFCREFDLILTLKRDGSDHEIEMNPGYAFFDISRDNLVIGFRYDTTAILNLEEAQEKLDRFHEVFGDKIAPKSRGLIQYDESINRYDYDRSYSEARFGEYRILYSLTPSFHESQYPQPPRIEWKPFIERLSIVYRGDDRKVVARWDKPIEPPEGYEHLSLYVPPRVIPNSKLQTTPEAPDENARIPKRETPAPKTKPLESPVMWPWLLVVFGLLTATAFIWRWKRKL